MVEPASNLDQIGFLLGRAYYSYVGLLKRLLDRNITDLATELQVAKSTMTWMVSRMRESGLLAVKPDP